MRSVILLLLSSLCSVSARATDTPQNPAHLVTQPLRFEKDGDAFIARGAGFSFRLLPGLMEMTAGGSVTASLQGASPVRPEGLDSQGVANYFRGNSPQNWRTGIPVFAKVRYRSVYPGIDVVFYGRDRTLEYDILAAPGSHPEKVIFHFSRPVTIDRSEIQLGLGFTWRKPRAFQEIDGHQHDVAAAFALHARNSVRLTLGGYDRTLPLTIDPVVTYASYIGTNCSDEVAGVALDPQGGMYVVGTGCAGLPGPNLKFTGDADAFVAKFTADGHLAYTTYLGGTGSDTGWGITADPAGNVWVVGDASSDFPRTASGGAPGTAFIAKLDTTGRLQFSFIDVGTIRAVTMDTLGNVYTAGQASVAVNSSLDPYVRKLAGNGAQLKSRFVLSPGHPYGEAPTAIAVDASGAVYICGSTSSIQFPVTSSAFQKHNVISEALPWSYTGYVAKIAADFDSMPMATYLGGTNQQSECTGIAVGKAGEVWVAGWTDASDFGSTATTVQPRREVTRQAFTARLSADGSQLLSKHTAEGVATASAIALDTTGNAYVTGTYRDPSFPVTLDITSPGTANWYNGFLSMFTPTGNLGWIASFGGSGWEIPAAIASDGGSNLAIAGITEASAGLLTADAAVSHYTGGTFDGFVARINLTKMPNWAVVTAVVNGASFQPGPIAPGTWFTVLGSNLAPTTRSWTGADFTNNGRSLPTKLDGVQILVNNVPALIAYISPQQINALAPSTVHDYYGDFSLSIVAPDGTRGNDVKYTIAKVSPAFFAYDGRYVVAHVGSEFIGRTGLIPGLATRPVRTGETITFYGTGFGPATPGTAPESLVTAAAPLASPVTIRIGGVSASVAYAGQTGSGLYQFNVVVPQVPAGDQRVDADITGIAVTAAMYLTVQ
jgi:uncharacterized protein (TIGR03437 family)